MRVKTASKARPTECRGQSTELVESFTYLGTVIDTQGGTVQDVTASINKAQAVFMKTVWR